MTATRKPIGKEGLTSVLLAPHVTEKTSLALDAPKTKLLMQQLKALALEDVLIIIEASDEHLTLAARNLPNVELLPVAAVNPVSLARHDKVLATVGAVKMLEERLQ